MKKIVVLFILFLGTANCVQGALEEKSGCNQALRHYMELEREHCLKRGNGKLYYNIGNCYFQLGQYPYAILYYNRAMRLEPRSGKVAKNLKAAQEKLGISQPPSRFLYLSLPERVQLFLALFILSLFGSSLYIWVPNRIFKRTTAFLVIAALLLLLGIGYTRYLAPIEAVVVNGSMLYRGAGKQNAFVRDVPVLSGLKVKVLEVLEQGYWLKIQTPAGEIGYVPFESVRFIEYEGCSIQRNGVY